MSKEQPPKTANEGNKARNVEKPEFAEHLSIDEMRLTAKQRQLKFGTFELSFENKNEAFVDIGGGLKVLVYGSKDMNRALTGDVVALQVYHKDMWRVPEGKFRVRDDEDDKTSNVDVGKLADGDNDLALPTGKVVGIWSTAGRRYYITGILEKANAHEKNYYTLHPNDRLMPRVMVQATEDFEGKLVTCRINEWPASSWLPRGTVVRTLGKVGERDVEEKAILIDHDIRTRAFTSAELAGLPDHMWRPSDPLEQDRKDFTSLDVFSVDPPGCTDIDDALHVRKFDDDSIEVGVHIADVSHFVCAGSALDLEASKRGTSVYLCNRRIDMLPEVLSSDLCSLRAGELRYACSVILKFNKNTKALSTQIVKSLIKSRAALTYQQAQDLVNGKEVEVKNKERIIIDGKATYVESKNSLDKQALAKLTDDLRLLVKLAKTMHEDRKKRGALTLASMEVCFDYDEEGNPISVAPKENLDTMLMIEEFMLRANTCVADQILGDFKKSAMLRRHPVPDLKALQPLINAGKQMGFEIHVENNKALSESLDKAVDVNNAETNTILRMIATRCMTRAEYFSSGKFSKSERLHYGLAVPTYTHFTSPIRRYADIVVHRQLFFKSMRTGHVEKLPIFDGEQVAKIAEELNKRDQLAERVNRASVILNVQQLLGESKVEIVAYVSGVKENGAFVIVPKFGVGIVVEYPSGCSTKLELLQQVKGELSVINQNQRRVLSLELTEPKLEGDQANLDIIPFE